MSDLYSPDAVKGMGALPLARAALGDQQLSPQDEQRPDVQSAVAARQAATPDPLDSIMDEVSQPPAAHAPTPSAPAADPLDDIMNEATAPKPAEPDDGVHLPSDDEGAARRISAYLAAHNELTPEQAAQLGRYSAALGVDPKVFAGQDISTLKFHVDTEQLNQALAGRPKLAKLLNDTARAPLAKDSSSPTGYDTGPLGALEDAARWAFGDWGFAPALPGRPDTGGFQQLSESGLAQAYRSAQREQTETGTSFRSLVGNASEQEEQQLARQRNAPSAEETFGAQSWLSKSLVGGAQFLPMGGGQLLATGIGAAVGTLIGDPAAGALAGNIGFNYVEGAGGFYQHLRAMKKADGTPLLTDGEAKAYAAVGGLGFVAATELIGGKPGAWLLGKIPGAKGALTKLFATEWGRALTEKFEGGLGRALGETFPGLGGIVKETLPEGTLRVLPPPETYADAAKRLAVRVGGTAVAGGLYSAHLQGADAATQYLASKASDPNSQADIRDVVSAWARAGLEGLKNMWALGLTEHGREFLGDMGRVAHFQADALVANQRLAAAEQSKLLERARQPGAETVSAAVEQHLESLSDEPQLRHMSVAAADRYWSGKKIDPEKATTELTGDAGAYQRAKQTGEKIAIPESRRIAQLGGTEHLRGMDADLSGAPDMPSLNEALEQVDERARQVAEGARVESDGADAVREDFKRKAIAAGSGVRLAAGVGELAAHAYRKLGSHYGISADEAYRKVGEHEVVGALGERLPEGLAPGEVEKGSRPAIRADYLEGNKQRRTEEYFRDENTGLYNARGDKERAPDPARPFRARFELGGQKYLNDQHGHAVPDGAFRAMAQVLRESGINDGVKLGDVEADVATPEQARAIAQKMSDALGVPVRAPTREKSLTGDALEQFFEMDKEKKLAEIAAGTFPDRGAPLDSFMAGKQESALAERLRNTPAPEAATITSEHHQAFERNLEEKDPFETVHYTPEGALTAEGSRRAREVAPKPAQLSGDIRGVGEDNKKEFFGKHGTDQIMSTVVRALVEAGGRDIDIARPHGDELDAQHADPDELERVFKKAQARLKKTAFVMQRADGSVVVQKGIDLAYATTRRADGESAAAALERADRLGLPEAKAAQRDISKPELRPIEAGAADEPQDAFRERARRHLEQHLEEVRAGGYELRRIRREPHARVEGGAGEVPDGSPGGGGGTGEGEGTPGGGGSQAGGGPTAGGLGREAAGHGEPNLEAGEPGGVGGLKLDQLAFHGTPHQFEKFSLEKIGTGEGNQAYGWGLYFASRKQIAETYRGTLLSSTGVVRRAVVEAGFHRQVAEAVQQHILEWVRSGQKPEKYIQDHDIRPDLLPAYEAAIRSLERGQIFHVDLPEDHELLDYDRHLSEQPPAVREAVERELRSLYAKSGIVTPSTVDLSDFTGRDVYNQIKIALGDSAEAASARLRELGIPGLRYLDNASRKAGEGTHNYVLWDESRVQVLKKDVPDTEPRLTLDKTGRGYFQLIPGKGEKPNKYRIRLLKDADESTLAHEFSHAFGRALHDLAMRADAPESLKAEDAALATYAGYASPKERAQWLKEAASLQEKAGTKAGLDEAEKARLKEIKTKEEKISHGFEQYLAEGKPPTESLARPFQMFRNWMMQAYQAQHGPAKQYLQDYGAKLELGDEGRRVFDRWFTSESAVRAAEPTGAFAALRERMTPEERAKDDELARAAHEAALGEMVRRVAEAQHEEVSGFIAEKRDEVRAEAEQKLDAQPVYQALRFLQSGELPDPNDPRAEMLKGADGQPMKLDRKALVEQYGKDFVRTLPRGIFAAKGDDLHAMSADGLATLLGGFDSGDDLVKKLQAAQPRAQALEAEVSRRLEGRVGPELLQDPQRLAQMAAEAVHNEEGMTRTLHAIEALRKKMGAKAGPLALSPEHAAVLARRYVDQRTVGELTRGESGLAGVYLRQERAAMDRAARASNDGKAAAELSVALLNRAMYRRATDLRREFERGRAKLDQSKGKPWQQALGKADPAFLEAHSAILQAIGASEPNPNLPRPSIEPLVQLAGDNLQGVFAFDADTIRKLVDDGTPWKKLSVPEARAVLDAVTNLHKVATDTNFLDLTDKRLSQDEFLAQLEQEARDARKQAAPGEYNEHKELGRVEKVVAKAKGLKADLTEMDNIVAKLGPRDGVLAKLFIDARRAARDREVELKRQVLKVVGEKYEKLPDWLKKHSDDDVAVDLKIPPNPSQPLGFTPTRRWLWALYLNWGTESSRQRIRDGNGWSDGQVQKALDQLTHPEAEYLQGILDAMNGLFPELQKVHQRRTGLPLEKQPPAKITIQGKEYAGGYAPIRYDENFGSLGKRRVADEISKAQPNNFRSPVSNGSYTKSRAESVKGSPVRISWDTVPAHLAQVAHDIAYGDWVRQVAALLNDKQGRFDRILTTHLGPELAGEVRPWLQDVARDQADSVAGATAPHWEGLSSKMRRFVAAGATMFNVQSYFRHLSDPLAALTVGVRPDRVGVAYAQAATDWAYERGERVGLVPNPERAALYEKSLVLRYRDASHADGIRKAFEEAGLKKGLGAKLIAIDADVRAGLGKVVDRAIFLGAYRQGLSDGLSPEKAVQFGDDAVSRTTPSFDVAERPALLRSKRSIAGAVMLMGYRAKMLNLHEGAWSASLGRGVATSLGLIAIGAGGSFAVHLGRRDDKQSWLGWAGDQALLETAGNVPLIGDVVVGLLEGKGVDATRLPEARYVSEVGNAITHLLTKWGDGETGGEKVWELVQVLLATQGGPVVAANQARRLVAGPPPKAPKR